MSSLFKKLYKDVVLESSGKDFDVLYHGSQYKFSKFNLDMKNIGTGTQHHGRGVYLIDDKETAMEYVRLYAVGGRGFLYACKLYGISNDYYYGWDDMIPLDLFMGMADEVSEHDEDSSIEMREYPEGYHGETWTFGDAYDILKHVISNINEFFIDFDIYGFTSSNRINPGAIEYCVLKPDLIKILNVDEVVV